MTLLSNVTGNMLTKFIKSEGYYKVRQRGSHMRYRHKCKPSITLNVTKQKKIKAGRLHGLLKEMEVPKEKFFDYFKIQF